MKKLAFIGAGHLSSSFIRGLVKSGYSPALIHVSNPNKSKLQPLAAIGAVVTTSNQEAVTDADIVFLGVKPGMVMAVCQDIVPAITSKKPLIVSLATGITVRDIAAGLEDDTLSIVRAMTNIALDVGMGSAALFANAYVTSAQKKALEALFNAVGDAFWVTSEADVNTLTPLIGSGPAFVYLFMEAIQQAAIAKGLPAAMAEQATLSMVAGALELVKQSKEPLSVLRERVTTPNGVTAAAMSVFFEKDAYCKLVQASFEQAIKRCEALMVGK